MPRYLDVNRDGSRVAHYSTSSDILAVYKLPTKISQTSELSSPTETLSLRVSPLSSICIHPKLPLILGIPYKKPDVTGTIPKGPASSSSSASNDKILDTTVSTKRVLLSSYSYYSKHITATPLVLNLPSPIQCVPSNMKFSSCGKYLAISVSSIEKTSFNQLYILDVENGYSLIAQISIDSGVEDLAWNDNSEFIMIACSDGNLRVFKFINSELTLIKSLNLSSSSLSSISFNNENNGILIGSRDGNSYYVDSKNLICNYSQISSDIDYPIINVSLTASNYAIITHTLTTINTSNDIAKIIEIPRDNVDVSSNFKEILSIDSIGNIGYGVHCTVNNILFYIGQDNKLIFRKIISDDHKTNKGNATYKTNYNNVRNNNLKKRTHTDSYDNRDSRDSREHNSSNNNSNNNRYWDRNKRFKSRQSR